MSVRFLAPALFDGDRWYRDTPLAVADGHVVAEPGSGQAIALEGGMIVPGFVDLQVNGGGGVLFNDAPSLETLTTLCSAHFAFGTTALLPTLITDTPEVTRAALAAGQEARTSRLPGFAGLHIEGPHLALSRKGAHDPALIRPMDERDFERLLAARQSLDTLLVTLAPETVPAERIAALAAAGIVVSLGHTDADFALADTAMQAGANMVTHLFNAMSPFTSRAPGVVGAALENGVWAGLIADGLHVDPVAIRIALRAKKGPGRIFLVTDAMSTIGTDLDRFTLNGREIVRMDGALRLADGTLAGADLTMIDAVRFMRETVGIPLEESLRMASLYPAHAIGRDDLGHLRPGARADFLHLGEDMDVRGVWIGGRRVI